MSKIKVSVIVPVYNVEKYIEKCLTSLVNQSLKEIEIIVVNDGSPDNSQVIIDKYVKRYPNKIKAFVKENGGQGSARNYGLKYARGEYISFVDSDDWIDCNALNDMYKLAIKDDSDIVICDMSDHYEDGTSKYYNCTKYDLIYEVTPSACNKIFKKDIIKDIRFLSKLWYEDFNFTTKILLNNPKISVISTDFYHCHCRNFSTMNNNNSNKNLDMIDILEDLKKYMVSNKIYDENIYCYLVFNHVLITTINRVYLHKNNEKKEVINKLIEYCHNNIYDYRNMPFYNNISLNRRIIAYLNYHNLYKFSYIILCIKSFVNKKQEWSSYK